MVILVSVYARVLLNMLITIDSLRDVLLLYFLINIPILIYKFSDFQEDKKRENYVLRRIKN
jgi:hypothetical protein